MPLSITLLALRPQLQFHNFSALTIEDSVMTIIFTGGTLWNRANASDPAFVISDADARAAVWRDFNEGLTADERSFFSAPDSTGRIGVTGAGTGAQANAHRHVRLLLEAVQNSRRTIYVMPAPVHQQMPATFAWVTKVTTMEYKKGFRIHVNGYGNFPVEWLDPRTAAGRSHHHIKPDRDACVYSTHLVGRRIDDAVARQLWRFRHKLTRWRRDDTVERYLDRLDTMVLFHELIWHCILDGHGHPIGSVKNIEFRAADNWLHDNPLTSRPLPADADCTPQR